MSSALIFEQGFGNSRQRPRWYSDEDGAYATVVHDAAEDLKVTWDLTDYLASGETVSSATYADSGAVTSSKSVSSPQVIFTITGIGETKVTVALSTGRELVRRWRVYEASGKPTASDYT